MQDKRKGFPFILGMITLITGIALLKQFDFQHCTFKKPALGVVYLIAFATCMRPVLSEMLKAPKRSKHG